MTQITNTTTQDGLNKAAASQGFLAALKGGLGLQNGGMFADFLSQFKLDDANVQEEAASELPAREEKKLADASEETPVGDEDTRAMDDLLAKIREERETLKALRKGKETDETAPVEEKTGEEELLDMTGLEGADWVQDVQLPAEIKKVVAVALPATTAPVVEEETAALVGAGLKIAAAVSEGDEAALPQEATPEEGATLVQEGDIDTATIEQALMFFRPQLSRAKEEETTLGLDVKTTESGKTSVGDVIGALGSGEPAGTVDANAGKEILKAKPVQKADVAADVPMVAEEIQPATTDAPRTSASEALKSAGKMNEGAQALQTLMQVFQGATSPAATPSMVAQAQAMMAANSDVPSITATQGAAKAHGTGGTSTSFALEGVRTASSYDAASHLSEARTPRAQASTQLAVIEQVSLHIKKQAVSGTEEMTLQLRPSDLGRIEVTLKFGEEKQVSGTVVADNAATLDLLLKDVGSLQRALQDAGLRADPGCLEFSLRGDGQQGQGSFADGRSSSSGANQNFPGLEEGEVVADAISVETYYLAPGRVNLSV